LSIRIKQILLPHINPLFLLHLLFDASGGGTGMNGAAAPSGAPTAASNRDSDGDPPAPKCYGI